MDVFGGLRVEEVLLLSLKLLLEFWSESRKHKLPHIIITLRGRFKGDTGDIWHLLPITDNNQSGILVIR